MSTISASTTSSTAYKVTADTTGALVLQTGATPTTAVTISSAQVVTLANALPIASGGTAATSASAARTSLGLVIGTDVLAPSGSGASLTSLNATNISSGTLATARLPAGSVLQVVQTTLDTQQSFTGATYTDVTGLSVSITPTATSSKILVRYRINGGAGGATTYHAFQILRNATAVGNGAQGTTRTKAHSSVRGQFSDANSYWTTSGEFLDSPATTSATTYKIQTATNGTTYINRAATNADAADYTSTLCSITVMEIAA